MQPATVPQRIRKELEASQLERYCEAYNAAETAGAGDAVAMWKGFRAVTPQRIVVAKCKLELFEKSQAKQVFYAWASVVEKGGEAVVDWDGDGWTPAEMEESAWNFCASGGQHGIRHSSLADSELVGSLAFTADLQKALGCDLGRIGWLLGWRVHDSALWDDIDNGRLPMLSIGGSGIREPVT